MKLTATLETALKDIADYDRMGYPPHWKPKAREKLVAMGLVESRGGERPFFITEAGRAALAK